MTLEQLKDSIRTISLSHISISDFDYGEDALIGTTDKVKPYIYLELPYQITYSANHQNKTIQFALLVLLPSINDDNVVTDHESISNAERIGDAIITKIQEDIKEFRLTGINGVSLREFSDDNLNGFRFDVQGLMTRICEVELEGTFDESFDETFD
jgi:hypothetical protein